MRVFDFQDIKTFASAGAGIGNWLLDIDVLLQVAISVASLIYVVLMCKLKWQEYQNKKKEK